MPLLNNMRMATPGTYEYEMAYNQAVKAGEPNPGWSANYDTGEIFQDTTPVSITTALQNYKANPSSLKARQKAFSAIRKENKGLSGQLLGNYDGYSAFEGAVKQAYQPKLLGVVPGLLGDATTPIAMLRDIEAQRNPEFAKRVEQQKQALRRQTIDNFMAAGNAGALIQPGAQQNQNEAQNRLWRDALLSGNREGIAQLSSITERRNNR